VDDPLGLGALYPVRVNMRHHIMSHFFFPCLGHVVVDVFNVSLQLIDLFLGYVQAQFLLRLSQSDPEPSPGLEFHLR